MRPAAAQKNPTPDVNGTFARFLAAPPRLIITYTNASYHSWQILCTLQLRMWFEAPRAVCWRPPRRSRAVSPLFLAKGWRYSVLHRAVLIKTAEGGRGRLRSGPLLFLPFPDKGAGWQKGALSCCLVRNEIHFGSICLVGRLTTFRARIGNKKSQMRKV